MSEFDGVQYQARFDALARQGADVHGEAAQVLELEPDSVLDAGCGTGRVAIELSLHGVDVVGVDINESMIAEARRLAPALDWKQADLAELALDRRFDVVVMAGNVPLFCPPESRSALVQACARHVAAGGWMVAGFQLGRGYLLADYDVACEASGLTLVDRWSTWDKRPWSAGDDYAVSVHRLFESAPRSPGLT